ATGPRTSMPSADTACSTGASQRCSGSMRSATGADHASFTSSTIRSARSFHRRRIGSRRNTATSFAPTSGSSFIICTRSRTCRSCGARWCADHHREPLLWLYRRRGLELRREPAMTRMLALDAPDLIEPAIAVIGGSGFYDLPGVDEVESVEVATPFGVPSETF